MEFHMSYCVNCGVELDKTCSKCPLCNTQVYNPNQPVDTTSPTPYPSKKGVEEPEKHSEFVILMFTVLATISVVCVILNGFLFESSNWSVYVVGMCVLFWVFLNPLLFPGKLSRITWLFLNGCCIAIYLGVIAYLHPGNGWYFDLGLPITAFTTALTLNFYYFTFRKKASMLLRTGIFLGSIAALCVAIELLGDAHYQNPMSLSWSAIVLICCVALDVVLFAISYLKDVRAELRRRMHF